MALIFDEEITENILNRINITRPRNHEIEISVEAFTLTDQEDEILNLFMREEVNTMMESLNVIPS